MAIFVSNLVIEQGFDFDATFELEEGGLVTSRSGHSSFNLGAIAGFRSSSSSHEATLEGRQRRSADEPNGSNEDLRRRDKRW